MKKRLHPTHPLRIFAFSGLATIAGLIGALLGFGASGLLVAAILIIVEITFSFENAVINAKVLSRLSDFWQKMFLTVGIVIAIFGMRVVFPILIVVLTAHLGWHDVIDLALNHPKEYAHELDKAHPQIAAFGGAFLLMLALHFFLDDKRETLWFTALEKRLQGYAMAWMPAAVALAVIGIVGILPFNHHQSETFIAGVLGIITYSVINGVIRIFESVKEKKDKQSGVSAVAKQTGIVALTSFLYLEILDASFSFDGVIGAFAVTNDVVLIALGLGVGAIWVRSLTVFIVRNGTLDTYKYLEHGAHYTVFVLAIVLLLGLFFNVPEVFAGLIGIGLIGSAILSSHERTHPKL
jgi:hypothetical protein